MFLQPLYLRPDLEAEVDRLGYSAQQRAMVRRFAQDGFLDLDLHLSQEFTDDLIREVQPYYLSRYATDPGRVLNGPTKAAKSLAANEQVISTLWLLYGREPFPFQTLNFSVGTQQRTHADTIHFDSFPQGYMAGVWVALEDVDPDNGPLHYFPGSHKLPHLTLADFGLIGSQSRKRGLTRDYVEVYEPGIAELVKAHGFEKHEALIKRGHAFIWAANLLHGGSPIRQPGRSRHSQVTHYFFHDCAYVTPMFSDPVLGKFSMHTRRDIRTGQKVPSIYNGKRVANIRRSILSRLP